MVSTLGPNMALGNSLLVGALEHDFFMTFHILEIIWNNHPNWRTHIFQRGGSTTNQIINYKCAIQWEIYFHMGFVPLPCFTTSWTAKDRIPMTDNCRIVCGTQLWAHVWLTMGLYNQKKRPKYGYAPKMAIFKEGNMVINHYTRRLVTILDVFPKIEPVSVISVISVS